MSATTTTLMTTTLVGTPSAMTNVVEPLSEKSCPTCGTNGYALDASEAQRRISELEGQIQEMTAQASVSGKYDQIIPKH